MSLALTAASEGGHSSMPPRETAVGVLAMALHWLQADPFPPRLEGATAAMFDYAGPEMPFVQRMVFANRWLFGPLIISQLSATPSSDATLRTTTAPTMLAGSPKDNVLPSRAEAVVNFRILPGETGESVRTRVESVIDDPRIEVAFHGPLRNPSTVSPAEGPAFTTLQQTIHGLFPEVVVAPYLVVGGTDARHYSAVSQNVYRFLPVRFHAGDLTRMHGLNERVRVDDYADAIRFYRQLILNASAAP